MYTTENWLLSDEFCPKPDEIYIPDSRPVEAATVPYEEITEKEAVQRGFSFHRKTKSVRITNYHGTEKNVVVPSKIGGKPVNELAEGAFEKSAVDCVEIPGCVRKMGERLFRESKVRTVRFGSGITKIPSCAFKYCGKLFSVTLPDTLTEIGESAFFRCAALEHIAFSGSLRKIGKSAFINSGLKGFSIPDPSVLYDGEPFRFTPLHENYKLILGENSADVMRVLLVGDNAKVKFPKKRIFFCENAVSNSDYSSDEGFWLDLSECTRIDMRTHSFYKPMDESVFLRWSYTPGRRRIVIMPDSSSGEYLPKYVRAVYKDMTEYKRLGYYTTGKNGKLCVNMYNHYYIPNYFFETGKELISINYRWGIQIERHAFNEPNLRRLSFDGIPIAKDEIFTDKCGALREVRWKCAYGDMRVQYIPPSELIGEALHSELLKAFRRGKTDSGNVEQAGLFDCGVVDGIFASGEFEYRRSRISLKQRQFITIAIDVLRGTDYQYALGTERYVGYLRRHMRYAKLLCVKLSKRGYPEYGEFLKTFGKTC